MMILLCAGEEQQVGSINSVLAKKRRMRIEGGVGVGAGFDERGDVEETKSNGCGNN